MSPGIPVETWLAGGFPRVSGDEPTWDPLLEMLRGFSPRERG